MTNATSHSIYSVAPGNPCKLSEINVSFVHFFVADSFRPFILCVLVDLPPPFNICSFRLCCVSLALKMAQKKLCPGTPKKKKKTSGHSRRPPAILTAAALRNLPQGPVVQPTQNTSRTGSHHHNQKLNQWDVEKMKNALAEWCYWEECRVRMGLKHLEMSKAQITKNMVCVHLPLGIVCLARCRDTNTGLVGLDSPKFFQQVSNRYISQLNTFRCACRKTNLDLSCMLLDLISLCR